MASGRIINALSKGGGDQATDLSSFLSDMSDVPDSAKGRCAIAIYTLRDVREVYRLKDSLDRSTMFLSVSTGEERKTLAHVNQDQWQDPVIIVGSLHTLAYDVELNRIGKIAFYGGAALLPQKHPMRESIEKKLHMA